MTLKEVKKGLEEIYRHIEKQACNTESNLIQVIWYTMQDEFLSQYKAIQTMIERCYPSTNLSLIFTINDVLQVFSDMAQSHWVGCKINSNSYLSSLYNLLLIFVMIWMIENILIRDLKRILTSVKNGWKLL